MSTVYFVLFCILFSDEMLRHIASGARPKVRKPQAQQRPAQHRESTVRSRENTVQGRENTVEAQQKLRKQTAFKKKKGKAVKSSKKAQQQRDVIKREFPEKYHK